MYLTNKHMSRRTVLKSVGATLTLPFLEAMVPARRVLGASAARKKSRLVAIEMVHGSAGSTPFGIQQNLLAPAVAGREFEMTPILRSLDPFREYVTIVSNTDVGNANASIPAEVGGDHYRSTAVFLSQAHPKQTQGSDVQVGVSLDQLYAQRFGQDTPIPSMQLCIEPLDAAGGCAYGYSCVYTDSLSWSSATQPLPMVRDPRVVFAQLFGAGATPQERAEQRAEDRSIIDALMTATARLKTRLGTSDRARLSDYLENVREIEQRIQKIEAHNMSGEVREMPEAPVGVPDSFSEHVKLMFDLQVLAFASDITRVFTFKMSRDTSNRVYPDSGVRSSFHGVSHHSERPDGILEFAKINTYHVNMAATFLEQLKNTPDESGGNLLDNSLVLYGSPLGDSHIHNHKRCPLFLAGHAGGQLRGGVHLKAVDGTPMANVMLSMLHKLGLDDLSQFGDSTGEFDLNGAAPGVTAGASRV